MLQPRVCLDFDATLCGFDYPGIGPIEPGALAAVRRLKELGCYVIVSSCRTCGHFPEIFAPDGQVGKDSKVHKEMVAWLDAHNVPYDEVDDGTKGKPLADLYVDDKGYRYAGNWADVVKFVEENIVCRM